MKRRFIPIIPITVALLLISGFAYALERKKQAKPVHQLPDTIHEEEAALQAELLAATEDHQIKSSASENESPREIRIIKPSSIKHPVKTKM